MTLRTMYPRSRSLAHRAMAAIVVLAMATFAVGCSIANDTSIPIDYTPTSFFSPVQGADRKGPTAVIRSAAKMDHVRTGGTLLNQKFTPRLVASDAGLDKVAHLVRSYFEQMRHHNLGAMVLRGHRFVDGQGKTRPLLIFRSGLIVGEPGGGDSDRVRRIAALLTDGGFDAEVSTGSSRLDRSAIRTRAR